VTTLLQAHPIPTAYRRGRIEALDPHFRRALAIAAAPAALLLLVVAFLPASSVAPVSVDELPERFARLILEETAAPLTPTPTAGPSEVETPESPAKISETVAPPKASPRARRNRPSTMADDQGKVGRDRANSEVVQQLASVTESLDKSLSAITRSLDQTQSTDAASNTRRRGRATRRGRRNIASVGEREPTTAASLGETNALSVAAIDLGSVRGVDGGLGSGAPGAGAASAVGDLSNGQVSLGERSQSSLLQVVRRYAPGIRYCYDHALKSAPDLQGKTVFRLRIEADGSVSGVEVIEDTLRRDDVRDCATAQIRSWVFPAASGPTVFETPFVFRPRR
jgi:hypothetical protein